MNKFHSYISYLSIFFSLLTFHHLSAQENIELLGQMSFDVELNDVWGYVDDEGREYALVAMKEGFSIVDVTDPTELELLYSIDGGFSTWRDVKTWQNYAYLVDDAVGEGLIIIDLSEAPNSFSHTTWVPPVEVCPTNDLESHNIYIDEQGYAYLLGFTCDGTAYGMIILDLNENPTNPTIVGGYGPYVHDAFVRNDTAWLCQMNDGAFVVADVSDKSDIVTLAIQETSGNNTHQIWLSDDGQYAFTNDENENGFIDCYDVSDLTDINRVNQLQSSPGEDVIPHNNYVLNNYLIIAYNTDGVVIYDVSQADSLVEFGRYDTSPDYSGAGFHGCWGVYPFLPSGVLLASDRENGLFVLQPSFPEQMIEEPEDQEDMVGLSIPNNLNANILNAKIGPNPMKDYFSIQISDYSNSLKTHFQLSDVHGQIVLSKMLSNANTTFSVEHLPVGLYFTSLTQNGQLLYTNKLIKE